MRNPNQISLPLKMTEMALPSRVGHMNDSFYSFVDDRVWT